MNAIARVARALAGNDAADALAVILASKSERLEAALKVRKVTSNSASPGGSDAPAASLDTPIKIGTITYLKSSISAASEDERHVSSRPSGRRFGTHKSKGSSLRLTSRDVHAEAVALFGDGVVPWRSRIRELANEGNVGTPPKKRGQPKVVSDGLNSSLVKYVALLRRHKIPVYKHSAMLHLTTLVDGTPLADRLKKNGEWEFKNLNNWHYRYFLEMDGIKVGD